MPLANSTLLPLLFDATPEPAGDDGNGIAANPLCIKPSADSESQCSVNNVFALWAVVVVVVDETAPAADVAEEFERISRL